MNVSRKIQYTRLTHNVIVILHWKQDNLIVAHTNTLQSHHSEYLQMGLER